MTEVNKQVALGTDDGYELDTSTMYLANTLLVIGYSSGTRNAGLRWQSLNIPQGASITSAKLSIYVTADTGTLSANVRGIAEDNALTWSNSTRPSRRDKTTATVQANEADWNNWGTSNWADIDITSVIQEIINRVGWSANNDLAVVIEDTAGAGAHYINVRSYEATGNLHGAKLDIVYSEAGETAIPVIINHLRQQGIL